MNAFQLVAKEIRFRWLNFALAAAGVSLASAIGVALSVLHQAAQKETRRVQRDIGFNLRILPKDADLESYLLSGASQATMQEEVAFRLAVHETIAYNHIVAMLEGPIEVAGKPALLTGLSPTLFPPGQERPPMSQAIAEGTAQLGYHVAKRVGAKPSGEIEINGELFTIARVAPEAGDKDDLRVWVHLKDAQRLLEKPGRISEIRAIDCLCLARDESPQEKLRKEIANIVPEAQLAMLTGIADARARQRRMIDRLARTAAPVIVVVAALWVALLAYLNVRQRSREIGVLRALGRGGASITMLVAIKAFVIGGVGGLIGALLGGWFALAKAPQLFPITGAKLQPPIEEITAVAALSCVVACIASLAPAAIAASQDPAAALRED